MVITSNSNWFTNYSSNRVCVLKNHNGLLINQNEANNKAKKKNIEEFCGASYKSSCDFYTKKLLIFLFNYILGWSSGTQSLVPEELYLALQLKRYKFTPSNQTTNLIEIDGET